MAFPFLAVAVIGAAVIGAVMKGVEIHNNNVNREADRKLELTMYNLDAGATARANAEASADQRVADNQYYADAAAARVHDENMAAYQNYQGPVYTAPRSEFGNA